MLRGIKSSIAYFFSPEDLLVQIERILSEKLVKNSLKRFVSSIKVFVDKVKNQDGLVAFKDLEQHISTSSSWRSCQKDTNDMIEELKERLRVFFIALNETKKHPIWSAFCIQFTLIFSLLLHKLFYSDTLFVFNLDGIKAFREDTHIDTFF